MRAERVGAETLLAQIVRMVAEAQRSRAPIQRLADTVAGCFVPAVIAIAVATFAVWALVGPEPRMAYALINAVAVLIIACPCALGLATPMSIMVATGKAATLGVLFRNAEAIELLRDVDTLVVDKTGTLTEGRPTLVRVRRRRRASTRTRCSASRRASSARASTRSPEAIVAARRRARHRARGRREASSRAPARGVVGEIAGRRVGIGNRKLLDELGVDAGPLAERGRRACARRGRR